MSQLERQRPTQRDERDRDHASLFQSDGPDLGGDALDTAAAASNAWMASLCGAVAWPPGLAGVDTTDNPEAMARDFAWSLQASALEALKKGDVAAATPHVRDLHDAVVAAMSCSDLGLREVVLERSVDALHRLAKNWRNRARLAECLDDIGASSTYYEGLAWALAGGMSEVEVLLSGAGPEVRGQAARDALAEGGLDEQGVTRLVDVLDNLTGDAAHGADMELILEHGTFGSRVEHAGDEGREGDLRATRRAVAARLLGGASQRREAVTLLARHHHLVGTPVLVDGTECDMLDVLDAMWRDPATPAGVRADAAAVVLREDACVDDLDALVRLWGRSEDGSLLESALRGRTRESVYTRGLWELAGGDELSEPAFRLLAECVSGELDHAHWTTVDDAAKAGDAGARLLRAQVHEESSAAIEEWRLGNQLTEEQNYQLHADSRIGRLQGVMVDYEARRTQLEGIEDLALGVERLVAAGRFEEVGTLVDDLYHLAMLAPLVGKDSLRDLPPEIGARAEARGEEDRVRDDLLNYVPQTTLSIRAAITALGAMGPALHVMEEEDPDTFRQVFELLHQYARGDEDTPDDVTVAARQAVSTLLRERRIGLERRTELAADVMGDLDPDAGQARIGRDAESPLNRTEDALFASAAGVFREGEARNLDTPEFGRLGDELAARTEDVSATDPAIRGFVVRAQIEMEDWTTEQVGRERTALARFARVCQVEKALAGGSEDDQDLREELVDWAGSVQSLKDNVDTAKKKWGALAAAEWQQHWDLLMLEMHPQQFARTKRDVYAEEMVARMTSNAYAEDLLRLAPQARRDRLSEDLDWLAALAPDKTRVVMQELAFRMATDSNSGAEDAIGSLDAIQRAELVGKLKSEVEHVLMGAGLAKSLASTLADLGQGASLESTHQLTKVWETRLVAELGENRALKVLHQLKSSGAIGTAGGLLAVTALLRSDRPDDLGGWMKHVQNTVSALGAAEDMATAGSTVFKVLGFVDEVGTVGKLGKTALGALGPVGDLLGLACDAQELTEAVTAGDNGMAALAAAKAGLSMTSLLVSIGVMATGGGPIGIAMGLMCIAAAGGLAVWEHFEEKDQRKREYAQLGIL